MHYIGKFGCGTFLVFVFIAVAVFAGGLMLGNDGAEKERAQIQATIAAEAAKAEQQRIEMEAMVELERVKNEGQQAKAQSDLLAYVVTKSEERQDDMIYFVMNGTTKRARTETIMRIVGIGMFAFIVFAAVMEWRWAADRRRAE